MTITENMKSRPRFTVHDRCRKAREEADLSQIELALRMEVARATVSNYETGAVTRLRPIVLRAWADACGVEYDWLRWGDEAGKAIPGGEEPDTTPPGDINLRYSHLPCDLHEHDVQRAA